MERICRQCGCSGFHYNSRKMSMVCDTCGTPLYDPQAEQQQERELVEYGRTYAKAMEHLSAGNWGETINLMRPLIGKYPTDKKLYKAVIRAATMDFTDLAMEDYYRRSAASDAWDKLVRFHGVTRSMAEYAEKLYEKHRRALLRERNRFLAWLFAAALCSFLAGSAWNDDLIFISILLAAGIIGCLKKSFGHHPIKVIRQLVKAAPDYRTNPFVQDGGSL